MALAEAANEPYRSLSLSADAAAESQTLQYWLAQRCMATPLNLVVNAGRGEGYELGGSFVAAMNLDFGRASRGAS